VASSDAQNAFSTGIGANPHGGASGPGDIRGRLGKSRRSFRLVNRRVQTTQSSRLRSSRYSTTERPQSRGKPTSVSSVNDDAFAPIPAITRIAVLSKRKEGPPVIGVPSCPPRTFIRVVGWEMVVPPRECYRSGSARNSSASFILCSRAVSARPSIRSIIATCS